MRSKGIEVAGKIGKGNPIVDCAINRVADKGLPFPIVRLFADMACVGWVRLAKGQGQDLALFPNLKRWLETILARPAVKRALAIRIEAASQVDVNDPKVRAVLFGQRAR